MQLKPRKSILRKRWERLQVRSGKARLRPFRLVEWNLQDFFVDPVYPLGPDELRTLSEAQWQQLAGSTPLKSLRKLRQIAETILRLKPDVLALCEVGGLASLQVFNETFLASAYEPFLLPGNSDRGIESGFLLRRPLKGRMRSHRERPVVFHYPHEENPDAFPYAREAAAYASLGRPEDRRLSRDAPLLEIWDDTGLRLAILLTHLKSGFDIVGIDPSGRVRRAAEFRALFQLAAEIQTELGPDAPLVIAGDFNASLQRAGLDAAYSSLYKDSAGYEDALELQEVPGYERISQISYIRGQVQAQQLDYVFLPKHMHPRLVRASVDRYGIEEDLPLNFRQRGELPSDHYPIVVDLDV